MFWKPRRPPRLAQEPRFHGALLFGLFLAREALARGGLSAIATYVPVLGGCLELVMLTFLWDAVFEAQLTRRSLAREPLLWLGLALSLFPPAYHLILLAGASG